MQPKAKALAIQAEVTFQASVRGSWRRRLRQRFQEPGELPRGRGDGSWAADGLTVAAQQAKAVEEEDTQTTPDGLY
jgi:anti-sigma factor RsiW